MAQSVSGRGRGQEVSVWEDGHWGGSSEVSWSEVRVERCIWSHEDHYLTFLHRTRLR